MAQNKIIRIGPVALSATLTTNILNPAAAGSGTGYTPTASYIIIKRLHVVNKTGSAATFSLWIGATGANAAGTEWFNAQSVAANAVVDFYGQTRLDNADFLVGGASAGTTLTIELEGEVGLA